MKDKIITEGVKLAQKHGGKVVEFVAPAIVDQAGKIIEKRLNSQKEKVVVPELYGKDFHISLENGIDRLEKNGFETLTSIVIPNSIYRNYKPNVIVRTKPKAKTKVDFGTLVHVLYITSEVIEESRLLYEKELEDKKNRKRENDLKMAERKDKTQAIINSAFEKISIKPRNEQ